MGDILGGKDIEQKADSLLFAVTLNTDIEVAMTSQLERTMHEAFGDFPFVTVTNLLIRKLERVLRLMDRL